MNNVYFNDPIFMKSTSYEEFMKKNPNIGYLNVRAYAANAAIPISGLSVVISKTINNTKIIFFEGATDASGVINQIALPTPIISDNDQEVPPSEDYQLQATYENQNTIFQIKMYSNIQSNQNINIVPELRSDGSYYVR